MRSPTWSVMTFVAALSLAAILALLPGTWLWWSLYGLGITVNVLGFTVLNDQIQQECADQGHDRDDGFHDRPGL